MRIAQMLVVGLVTISSVAAAQIVPVAVSPGGTEDRTLIAEVCPTFSWGTVEGATAYELVVLRRADVAEMGAELEVYFQVVLPGSAQSWTPALDRCLSHGNVYAWTVRARLGGGASDWSEASVFEVSQPGGTAGARDVTRSEGVDLPVIQDLHGVAVERL